MWNLAVLDASNPFVFLKHREQTGAGFWWQWEARLSLGAGVGPKKEAFCWVRSFPKSADVMPCAAAMMSQWRWHFWNTAAMGTSQSLARWLRGTRRCTCPSATPSTHSLWSPFESGVFADQLYVIVLFALIPFKHPVIFRIKSKLFCLFQKSYIAWPATLLICYHVPTQPLLFWATGAEF